MDVKWNDLEMYTGKAMESSKTRVREMQREIVKYIQTLPWGTSLHESKISDWDIKYMLDIYEVSQAISTY